MKIAILKRYVYISVGAPADLIVNGGEPIKLNRGRYRLDTMQIEFPRTLEVEDVTGLQVEQSALDLGFMANVDGLPVGVVGAVQVGYTMGYNGNYATAYSSLSAVPDGMYSFRGYASVSAPAGGYEVEGFACRKSLDLLSFYGVNAAGARVLLNIGSASCSYRLLVWNAATPSNTAITSPGIVNIHGFAQ